VPAPGDYDDGEIGGMIGRGNRSTRRKLVPVPLCPPQTPHAARTRTRAAAMGSENWRDIIDLKEEMSVVCLIAIELCRQAEMVLRDNGIS
jgi:hypothetical protein